jgi:hypothetical protein
MGILLWRLVHGGAPLPFQPLLLTIAAILALLGALLLWEGDDRSQWVEATARIQSVREVCTMTSSRFNMRRRLTQSVVIDCDDVTQFIRDNDTRTWRQGRSLIGQVLVEGAAGPVLVERGLSMFGTNGEVGDRIVVMQNPLRPEEFDLPGSIDPNVVPGGMLMGLGIFLAALSIFLL